MAYCYSCSLVRYVSLCVCKIVLVVSTSYSATTAKHNAV